MALSTTDPIGNMDVSLVFNESDRAIVGEATSKEETVPIRDVVVDGDQVMWLQDVTTPMKMTLKFNVMIDGDTMTGTSRAGFLPASSVQGTRQTASTAHAVEARGACHSFLVPLALYP